MGVQVAVGQGPDLRGLPRARLLLALRDAAQQHRDAHGRRLPRPPGPGADRRLRAASTGRWPAPGCWPGRRRRGRCRPTSPSPSVPTSTTPSSSTTAGASCWPPTASAAYAAELGATPTVVGDRARRRPRRAALPPAVRLLHRRRALRHRAAFQVLGADFVSTEEGTGVVHMAPGFGEDDQLACNAVGIPTLVPMDEHGRYTAEVAPWVGEHVFEANPLVIRHLKDAGVVAAPRDLRPLVPALLALRPAARLPGDLVVVRRGHQVPRPHGRAQRADHVGARAPQARQLRQVAAERPRLVDQPQPLLGLADPGVAQRRPELPARRRLRLARRAGGRLRRAASPTCTARSSTSSCGPTPTTRPGAR